MSPEHVPAPQLASAAGAAFFVPGFGVGGLAAGTAAGLAGDAFAAAAGRLNALAGAGEGVPGDATPAVGATALGASDFCVLPEHEFAEQEA